MFAVGDEVLVKRGQGYVLQEGRRHRISHAKNEYGNYGLEGIDGRWREDRFQLAAKAGPDRIAEMFA